MTAGRRFTLCGGVAGLILGCLAPACLRQAPGAGPLRDTELKALAEMRESFVRFELSGDRRSQARLYSEDATLLEPGGPLLEGREAIRAGLEESDVVLSKFDLRSLEIGGDRWLAYDRGEYSLEYDPGGGAQPIVEAGNYFMMLQRQRDGSWRIAVLIHNAIP